MADHERDEDQTRRRHEEFATDSGTEKIHRESRGEKDRLARTALKFVSTSRIVKRPPRTRMLIRPAEVLEKRESALTHQDSQAQIVL